MLMDRKDVSRRWVQFACGAVIWLVLTAVWGYVWYRYYAEVIPQPFFRRGNWMAIAVYGILLFFITQFYGGYRVGHYLRGDIIFSGLISILLTNLITYLQTSMMYRDFTFIAPFAYMTAVDFVLIWIWSSLANKIYLRINPPRRLLVVYGGTSLAQSLIAKMAERADKYVIQEAVNIDEGIGDVFERIDRYKAVLICDVKSTSRNLLLKHCYERSIRVYMTPKISDILIRGAGSIHLFDSPLLLNRNTGLNVEQRFFKRVTDMVLSLLALAVFSPFMLLIAAAIKLCDGGPVLYAQERLTIGGRTFRLYKFRSMVVDAEEKEGAQLSSQADARVTPVGKVIRKIRFDEIPQFYNILRGDMSLVGPRPERPEIAAEYRDAMPEFDFRLKVKAGLTGYAQVHGKYNTTPYDKLKLDLMYIAAYSYLMDLKLILQTIKTLFTPRSTQGVPEGQRTAEECLKPKQR